MHCKIAFYDFGSTAIMHRHLICMMRSLGAPLSFCAIQPNPYYRALMREVLDPADILDVFAALPRGQTNGDPSVLVSYPSGFIEDLAALKRTWRRRRRGQWWFDHGVTIYQLYKQFLTSRQATHLFMPTVETPEAKIAVAAARELGLGIMVPTDMRNVGGGYFACDCMETPPLYAESTAETRAVATQLVRDFREKPFPARRLPEVVPDDPDYETIECYLPSLWKRIFRFVLAALERPDLFEPVIIRLSLMRNFAWIREPIRGQRARRNAAQYDIEDVTDLPKRFIYYPLHFTPEASINTPAPFYVDQKRAIDALRLAMPNGCILVVKEHPTCLPLRPTNFFRQLSRLPGVMVAKVTMPSLELVKRAALTVTVTGTTALEAFLLGRPATLLGPAIPSWLIRPHPPANDVRAAILAAIDNPPSDEFIIERLAHLLSVRYPFAYGSVHEPGEPVLRRGNMRRMCEALLDHLERDRRAKERAGETTALSLAVAG
jgi:Capsule polysaccharide biosynthesis protein